MSQILTIVIDREDDGRIAVSTFSSDGLTNPVALGALQAVERDLQRHILRAELEAERAAKEQEDDQT